MVFNCLVLAWGQEEVPGSVVPLESWILHAKLIHEVLPEYPASARANHIQGNVYINVLVDENGKIKTASAENCPACSLILNDAAVQAVKKWEYHPTILNGKPISVRSYIIFRFQLEKEPAVEVLTRSESTDPAKPLPAFRPDERRGVIGGVIDMDSAVKGGYITIAPPRTSISAEWKEYVFADDLFKVSSPIEPVLSKQSRDSPYGKKEVHWYSMVSNRFRYVIAYEPLHTSDHRSPKQVLNEIKKNFAISALPNTERSISLGKYPGFELEIEDASTHSRNRVYIANHGLYVVIATVRKGEPFPEDLKRWDASLTFLEPKK